LGGKRYSHECIEHCKDFILCFPSTSKFVKPPIIEGSTVAYECKVVDKIETGDHTVYVGKIVAIHGTTEKPSHLYSIHYEKLINLAFNDKKS
jgi:flavin reductase (DIM6/NTAB) family NADH-FMN oxidoreductase RutF